MTFKSLAFQYLVSPGYVHGAHVLDDEERVQIFREWYQKAPRLLPITACTFQMDDGGHGLRPVMSVYGFDTIFMGWSMRHFLMLEFATELGLIKMYYDT